MDDILARLVELEGDIRYDAPAAGGEPAFRHAVGWRPVLLSAPHGAAHRRDGRYKNEDEYTAAFVRLLAERTGAHALYAHARSDSDPNWDADAPYKTALAEIAAAHNLRFVLDLHGMGDRHKFGVAVGTMCGASCPAHHEALITATLTGAGFSPATAQEARDFPALRWDRFVLNHGRFTGGLANHTVTRFVAATLGIHAAQVELCASLRIVRRLSGRRAGEFRGDAVGITRVVAALEQLVLALSQHA